MKIEQLRKKGTPFVPITHAKAVYFDDGHNLHTHLANVETPLSTGGVYRDVMEEYAFMPSVFWCDATPRVSYRQRNQFSTTPIQLLAGDTLIFDCYCDGRLSALASLTSMEESISMSASRKLVGSSSQEEIKRYTYTAETDIIVKITCYDSKPLKVYISRNVKVADNSIEDLSERIEDAEESVANVDRFAQYDNNAGEGVDYQEFGATDYAIIMMYGQSLSIGQENPAGYDDPDVENCYMLEGGVHSIGGSKLIPLGTGMPISEGINSQRQDPVISTAKAFVNLYHKAHPEDTHTKFIAISLGVGGRSLVTFADSSRYPWITTSYMEDRVKPCLTALKAIATSEGKTISIGALIWCQGETDYSSTYIGKSYAEWYALHASNFGGSLDAYKQGLKDLRNDITTVARTIFGADNQQLEPPFFAYALGGGWIGNSFLTINHAIYDLANEIPNMWIIAPNYPVPDYNGGHLAMNGYRWYGEYIAKAMYYTLIKRTPWSPLKPTSVELSGGKVVVHFDRAITIDTYTNDECPDYGFVVRQGTITQLNSARSGASEYNMTISSVVVGADGKSIEITTEEPLTSEAVEVIYAGTSGTTYANRHVKGSGNVRDNDNWRALYTFRSDNGDHGNLATGNYWTNEVASAEDIATYSVWDSATSYSYGDIVIYTFQSTAYKCTSLRQENKNNPPITSDGYAGYGTAWERVNYDANVSDIDEQMLAGNGYAYGAKVNVPNIGMAIGMSTMQSLIGSTTGGNKVYPYTKVDYSPVDSQGNSIVGKKYPMQNWCINFYKRITNE